MRCGTHSLNIYGGVGLCVAGGRLSERGAVAAREAGLGGASSAGGPGRGGVRGEGVCLGCLVDCDPGPFVGCGVEGEFVFWASAVKLVAFLPEFPAVSVEARVVTVTVDTSGCKGISSTRVSLVVAGAFATSGKGC